MKEISFQEGAFVHTLGNKVAPSRLLSLLAMILCSVNSYGHHVNKLDIGKYMYHVLF